MSGGLDSTSLSLIASKIFNKKIETYTLVNDFNYLSNEQNKKFNEDSSYAIKIAKENNIINQVVVNEKSINNFMESSFEAIEEPSYSFQKYLYTRYSIASQKNKVLITGEDLMKY